MLNFFVKCTFNTFLAKSCPQVSFLPHICHLSVASTNSWLLLFVSFLSAVNHLYYEMFSLRLRCDCVIYLSFFIFNPTVRYLFMQINQFDSLFRLLSLFYVNVTFRCDYLIFWHERVDEGESASYRTSFLSWSFIYASSYANFIWVRSFFHSSHIFELCGN